MIIRRYKPFLPHLALIGVGVALIVGIFMLVQSEEAKTRDIVRMQEVISMKQALTRYFLNHAAYPAAPKQFLQLGL